MSRRRVPHLRPRQCLRRIAAHCLSRWGRMSTWPRAAPRRRQQPQWEHPASEALPLPVTAGARETPGRSAMYNASCKECFAMLRRGKFSLAGLNRSFLLFVLAERTGVPVYAGWPGGRSDWSGGRRREGRSHRDNTNSRYETDTNSDGLYNFPLLLPGQYELTAEAKGFKGSHRKASWSTPTPGSRRRSL